MYTGRVVNSLPNKASLVSRVGYSDWSSFTEAATLATLVIGARGRGKRELFLSLCSFCLLCCAASAEFADHYSWNLGILVSGRVPRVSKVNHNLLGLVAV